jgi:hypothetical protein
VNRVLSGDAIMHKNNANVGKDWLNLAGMSTAIRMLSCCRILVGYSVLVMSRNFSRRNSSCANPDYTSS